MPSTYFTYYHPIHNLARALKRRFEEETRQFGLTMPQWRILNQLSKTDEISQVALANLVDMDAMTLSGILERLETKSLIERVPDPSDSRAKRVKSTAEALAIVTDSRELIVDIFEEALEGVTPVEREAFFSILARMESNLSKQRHPIQEFDE